MKILVTTPCYDNIGEVLKKMNIPFSQYSAKNTLDCDILFMNCGTPDVIDKSILIDFVRKGGILYASDLTSTFLNDSFPNTFNFNGSGTNCTLSAKIVDNRLIEYIGNEMTISFDLSGWSMLESISSGKVLMKRNDTGKPIMVEVPFENGRIYYTSFHNHAQASEKEVALLNILVLTQISAKDKVSLKQAADKINFNIDRIKQQYGSASSSIVNDNSKTLNQIDNILSKFDSSNNIPKANEPLPDVDSTINKF
ncbi:MAG: hypothetical protein KDE33_05100 [Bacteroidetes bacterium]|nr:hypothetical protein [Bacteroidota bacterium]